MTAVPVWQIHKNFNYRDRLFFPVCFGDLVGGRQEIATGIVAYMEGFTN
jgi:hypothetical protein